MRIPPHERGKRRMRNLAFKFFVLAKLIVCIINRLFNQGKPKVESRRLKTYSYMSTSTMQLPSSSSLLYKQASAQLPITQF